MQDSDESWEPEPCEDCDGKASRSSPSLSERDDDMSFVRGTRPQHSHYTHQNYGLTALGVIPMPAPLKIDWNTRGIEKNDTVTGPEAISTRKRHKQGILGKVP